MEAGCRRFFVTVMGIIALLAAVTVMKQIGLLEFINDPTGSIPENIPIPK